MKNINQESFNYTLHIFYIKYDTDIFTEFLGTLDRAVFAVNNFKSFYYAFNEF